MEDLLSCCHLPQVPLELRLLDLGTPDGAGLRGHQGPVLLCVVKETSADAEHGQLCDGAPPLVCRTVGCQALDHLRPSHPLPLPVAGRGRQGGGALGGGREGGDVGGEESGRVVSLPLPPLVLVHVRRRLYLYGVPEPFSLHHLTTCRNVQVLGERLHALLVHHHMRCVFRDFFGKSSPICL